DGNLEDAVSEDGTLAYWTSVTVGSTGTIFLREHPEQGTVPGECESGKACTRRVSGLQFPAFSFFWRGTPDGTKALFSEPPLDGGEEDELFEFSLARLKAGEPARRKLADEVVGVLGASDDLSRIYFISRQALPGTGGKAGEPNVYLREEDGAGEASFRLVATVSKGDAGAVEPGASFPAYDLAEERPYLRATRVSPDGAWLAFNSRAKLTNYDNTDTATGKPAVEVYAYDAEADELHCASCNPSGARPVGAEMGIPYNPRNLRTSVIAAAWIPTWEHPNYASNVLSGQGGRLFFNSSDQLVPRDANGAQDVYQWQVAGSGGCTASSPSYFPQNGGCVDLISSGESQHESEFWEASPDGEDVFFTTASSLVPPDPGLVDLYDARVGGGFPQLPEAGECEGEACQSPPAPPDFGAPASTTYSGPGNPPPRRCRRPARRSKAARRSTRRQGKAGRRCPPKGRAARRAGR
ncbi:MAG TPA: hypothetical protein VFM94_06680, partial [Solirubrobacterales bacterium]|nr:hypothetical protein [Solirubrobacterales bacterium]